MSDDAHDLHLPHGSWWPVALALAITFLGVTVVMGGMLPIVGVIVLLAALGGWVKEDTKWWREKVGTGEPSGRLGIALFMSSEIFLFGALFATYFTFRSQSLAIGEWPDQHVELPILKTGLFSLVLISSSFTAYLAEKKLHNNDKKGFHLWWGITILFGAIFLAGQVWEYVTLIEEGVTLNSSHFASTFYMITGTHGLHVLGGLIFLIIVYVRSLKGQFDGERNLAPTAASWYWHFVDAIWIIVFTMLYIIQ
jgi:heme/copper-type cytochrome/quinol oxidase subunit 3